MTEIADIHVGGHACPIDLYSYNVKVIVVLLL